MMQNDPAGAIRDANTVTSRKPQLRDYHTKSHRFPWLYCLHSDPNDPDLIYLQWLPVGQLRFLATCDEHEKSDCVAVYSTFSCAPLTLLHWH